MKIKMHIADKNSKKHNISLINRQRPMTVVNMVPNTPQMIIL